MIDHDDVGGNEENAGIHAAIQKSHWYSNWFISVELINLFIFYNIVIFIIILILILTLDTIKGWT